MDDIDVFSKRGYTKEIEDKLLPELEKLGHSNIICDDLKREFLNELRIAQERLNLLNEYLKHACPDCNKMTIPRSYVGNIIMYQCLKCKYTEMYEYEDEIKKE